MQTVSDVDLELIFSLGDELEKKCEHSQHEVDQEAHSDNSTLSYVVVDSSCVGGLSRKVMIFCDTFLNFVTERDPLCYECGEPLLDHYLSWTPV